MKTVAKVNPRATEGQTTQGFYVIGFDGSAYVFNNNRNIERVIDAMARGKASYERDSHPDVELTPLSRHSIDPPEGTSVVRVYSRVMPVPKGCDPSNENLQVDHLWILKDEVDELTQGRVPTALSRRLSRFTFVDAIRGEPDYWTSGELKESVYSVASIGGGMRLTGKFKAQTASLGRGIQGSLTLELVTSGGAVTTVTGYAETTAWGQSTHTPNPPPGKFSLKFAFTNAPKDKSAVAPQAAMFGREYLAP